MNYMDLNLLIALDATEWRGAEQMMQAALSRNYQRLGLRQDEIIEAITLEIQHLLQDDARVLRKAYPDKVSAFIRADLRRTVQHMIRSRNRRENHERATDEQWLERIADANGSPWAGKRTMAYS